MQQWMFDKAEMKLIGDGKIVQITPRAAAVLECLLQSKGKTVTKAEILSKVWPGLHVTEDLIREYIFDLRTALGDDARNPVYIETLRGKGFRLVGKVAPADADGQSQSAENALNDLPRPAVAVLRPVDLNASDGPTTLPDRLGEAMISGLASHRDIEVIGRQSAFAIGQSYDLRDAAARLGADYLLESAIEHAGETLQGTFHLIDGKTGAHIWAERLSASAPDPARAIADLTHRLVNTLAGWHGELHLSQFKLALRKPLGSLNAYEHFIRGCDLELRFDAASMRRSLEHLDRSLELDPSFARCWVAKSLMLQWSYDVFEEKDRGILEASAEALAKAYLLDPRDPVTLALIALQYARQKNMAGAREALARGREGCESDADACVCIATALCVLEGDFDAASHFFDLALRINPVPPGWYRFVEARLCFFFGQYDRAIAASVSGPERVSALVYRCLSQAMLGQAEAAKISHARLLDRYPGFDFAFYADYFPIAAPAARTRYDKAVTCLAKQLDSLSAAQA